MSSVVYFAYGSNMSSKRLKARVLSAKAVGIGVLKEHALAFHKVSKKDGSGKCDIVKSSSGEVMGVLFEIDAQEKTDLDEYEGFNKGYDEKTVEITTESGRIVSAVTYYATNTDPKLKPYSWYLRHILEGAKEAGLPEDYIKELDKVEAAKDPNKEREAKELAIYG